MRNLTSSPKKRMFLTCCRDVRQVTSENTHARTHAS